MVKFNKQAIAVSNKVNRDSDDNIIGLTEANTKADGGSTSSNFGTPRKNRRGGCYKGNETAWVDLGSTSIRSHFNLEFDFIYKSTGSFQSIVCYNFHRIGALYYGVSAFVASNHLRFYCGGFQTPIGNIAIPLTEDEHYHIEVIYLNGTFSVYSNGIFVNSNDFIIDYSGGGLNSTIGFWWRDNGVTVAPYLFLSYVWNYKCHELDSNGDIVDSDFHYKCDENSGDDCFDSSGYGNNGTIEDGVTVPPEVDEDSIHQYQDIYSHHNEVGYTISDGISYYSDIAATQLIPAGVLIPRLETNE